MNEFSHLYTNLYKIQCQIGQPNIYPLYKDFESGEKMLARFAKTNSLALKLTQDFSLDWGVLTLNKSMHKNASGFYVKISKQSVIQVGNTSRTSLQEFFHILAHEMGHMYCRVQTGIASRFIRRSEEKLYDRERLVLKRSVLRNLDRNESHHLRFIKPIGYLYFGSKYKKYQGELEEALSEAFALLWRRLNNKSHKKDGIRSRPSHHRFIALNRDICMPHLSYLVKNLLPKMGLKLNSVQKGRVGLRPGKKYKLNSLYSAGYLIQRGKRV